MDSVHFFSVADFVATAVVSVVRSLWLVSCSRCFGCGFAAQANLYTNPFGHCCVIYRGYVCVCIDVVADMYNQMSNGHRAISDMSLKILFIYDGGLQIQSYAMKTALTHLTLRRHTVLALSSVLADWYTAVPYITYKHTNRDTQTKCVVNAVVFFFGWIWILNVCSASQRWLVFA